jgi:ABC-type polysaccharide/polyol phosphate transport system ATPase subunit
MADPGANGPAVAVDSVSKTFRLPHEHVHSLKERALHPFKRRTYDRLEALRDVSFDVAAGEFFGIVGRNASGKSTLLKLLAGIYRADAGDIFLTGRIAPFIELGVGFNPDLTARDNVTINGVMLGLSPARARERYDAIIDFAELEQFVDLKLKNYSAGMHVRLAFAVMVQADADILLIDEVLAVGDAAFQQKCHDTLNAMRDEGRTILFVTHDMDAVIRFCDRAMLLETGRIVTIDEPRAVARQYNEINFQRGALAATPERARAGDGAALILDAWFEDREGRRTDVLEQAAPCSFHAVVEAARPVVDPMLGFSVVDQQHHEVFAVSSAWSGGRIGPVEPGERLRLSVRFDNLLAPGRYFVSPVVAYDGAGSKVMDLREDFVTALVTGTRVSGGVIDMPHDLSVTRVDVAGMAAVSAE